MEDLTMSERAKTMTPRPEDVLKQKIYKFLKEIFGDIGKMSTDESYVRHLYANMMYINGFFGIEMDEFLETQRNEHRKEMEDIKNGK